MYYFIGICPNSRTTPSQTEFEPLEGHNDTGNDDNETDAADDDMGGDGDGSENRDINVTRSTKDPKNPFPTDPWVHNVAIRRRR